MIPSSYITIVFWNYFQPPRPPWAARKRYNRLAGFAKTARYIKNATPAGAIFVSGRLPDLMTLDCLVFFSVDFIPETLTMCFCVNNNRHPFTKMSYLDKRYEFGKPTVFVCHLPVPQANICQLHQLHHHLHPFSPTFSCTLIRDLEVTTVKEQVICFWLCSWCHWFKLWLP